MLRLHRKKRFLPFLETGLLRLDGGLFRRLPFRAGLEIQPLGLEDFGEGCGQGRRSGCVPGFALLIALLAGGNVPALRRFRRG